MQNGMVTPNHPSLYLSNYFHFEVMKQKESSCNHKEKEIVFENLISFLYQIAPIKCKWCEIISFLYCFLSFLFSVAAVKKSCLELHGLESKVHRKYRYLALHCLG